MARCTHWGIAVGANLIGCSDECPAIRAHAAAIHFVNCKLPARCGQPDSRILATIEARVGEDSTGPG